MSDWSDDEGPQGTATPAGPLSGPPGPPPGATAPPHTPTTVSAEAGSEPEASLVFHSAEEWLTQWLLTVWTRPTGGPDTLWCPEWWRHPEAVVRVTAMWTAWEHLRLDPSTGASVWWRDHGDYHLRVLHASDGPFVGCSPRDGHTGRPVADLATAPAPTGTFDSL